MLTFFNITQPGTSHIKRNAPGDDYSATERIVLGDTTYVIAAVADGVGSAVNSRFGSELAVKTAIAVIKELLAKEETNKENIANECLFPAFKEAYKAIMTYATEEEMSVPSLDTTLTVCIYDGDLLVFGHSGDDGVVAMSKAGAYRMITTRKKGDEVNSVYPLRFYNTWEFGIARNIASFVMMTDGVLDYVVAMEEQLHNRVFFPFVEGPLTDPIPSDEVSDKARDTWDRFLMGELPYGDDGQTIRDIITDDISFVVVQNSDAVEALPELPAFDIDEWNRESELLYEWQNLVLSLQPGEEFPSFPEWKSKKSTETGDSQTSSEVIADVEAKDTENKEVAVQDAEKNDVSTEANDIPEEEVPDDNTADKQIAVSSGIEETEDIPSTVNE